MVLLEELPQYPLLLCPQFLITACLDANVSPEQGVPRKQLSILVDLFGSQPAPLLYVGHWMS